jgi:hypothetical protein
MKNKKYGKGGTMSDGDAFVPTSRMKIDAYSKGGGLKGYMAGGDVTNVYDSLPNKSDNQLVRELEAKESTFFRPKFKTEQDKKNIASMRALGQGGSSSKKYKKK